MNLIEILYVVESKYVIYRHFHIIILLPDFYWQVIQRPINSFVIFNTFSL